ncbi:MAG TPA: hypothetical protein VGP51_09165 [Nocardioidaceae bacterium]|nr:hypothetical protein [Actinomycetota bacterium]MDQ3422037.1 hypothetical protein [Actinomycetota bacterium]HEV8056644.1 hypothetical protein [Nocardioidaceae bacterium]
MRWDELFADLESEWGALSAAERASETADRTRAELAQITLLDRLRASVDGVVDVRTGAGERHGVISRVGADFVLLDEMNGRELLLPTGAILGVSGLAMAARSALAVGPVASRLGLRSALRGLVRDRSAVTVLQWGECSVHGTPRVVGADYLELAVHHVGEPPRPQLVRRIEAIPFTALCGVRREAPPW